MYPFTADYLDKLPESHKMLDRQGWGKEGRGKGVRFSIVGPAVFKIIFSNIQIFTPKLGALTT